MFAVGVSTGQDQSNNYRNNANSEQWGGYLMGQFDAINSLFGTYASGKFRVALGYPCHATTSENNTLGAVLSNYV